MTNIIEWEETTGENATFDQLILLKHGGIMIAAEMLRQYMYCRRIPYFRLVQRVWPPMSYKMERGVRLHEKKVRDFNVRVTRLGETYFNVYIESPYLGLHGLLDSFEYDGTSIYPVEIKTGGSDRPDKAMASTHHKHQLVVQALLLEDCFSIIVSKAKIKYVDTNDEFFLDITLEDKREALRIVREMQAMIHDEALPPAPADDGKCTDCEFWLYCMRV